MSHLLNTIFSNEFIKTTILLFLFLSIVLLVLVLLPDEKQALARKRLGIMEESRRETKIALLRWFRPFYVAINSFLYSATLPGVITRYMEKERTQLRKKLITANINEEISPDEFVSFRVVMSVVVPLIITYLAGALGRPLSWSVLPFIMVGGYFFPDLWLRERISSRRRAIVRALPYTLDLLTLSVEAGLDFMASIQRLIQRGQHNALIVEFNHMLKEIRLGTSRSDALRSLSDRLQIEEISSFTTLLIQTDQLGASIGQVLRAQSEQLRAKRFQTAESAGAKASQLILFPLVLCIFPAIFVVVLGPILLNILQKGLF